MWGGPRDLARATGCSRAPSPAESGFAPRLRSLLCRPVFGRVSGCPPSTPQCLWSRGTNPCFVPGSPAVVMLQPDSVLLGVVALSAPTSSGVFGEGFPKPRDVSQAHSVLGPAPL